MTDVVLVDRPRPDIALVTLNRPERMNAMAFDVMVPLRKVLQNLTDDTSTRVVILTDTGRGFSSGADHKSAGSVPAQAASARHCRGERPRDRRRAVPGAGRRHPHRRPHGAYFRAAGRRGRSRSC